MGILVPLYLAGLTALSLPLILHLVRRTPRGRQEFSSLMFLSPTPPRLTRRSRLDQILLLLLRLAALALIALAFARPFLREAALLTFADLTGKRVAILIDTSASMKRGDLWQQAVAAAERQLDDLNEQDDVALFAFGGQLRPVIEFQKRGEPPLPNKSQLVRSRLKQLQPDWSATDLGNALISVARELDTTGDVEQSTLDPQLIVISDFQSGSRIEALQSFEWPKGVPVVTRPVTVKQTTNAHAHLLPNEEGDESKDARVRVVNATDSTSDQFTVSWATASSESQNSARTVRVRGLIPPAEQSPISVGPRGIELRVAEEPTALAGQASASSELPVYVHAGQSRVIRLPRGDEHLLADRIVLRGDEHDFDNTFFVVPPRKLEATLLYAGKDAAEDPEGLQLYLRLAVANDPLRQIDIRPLDDAKALSAPAELAPKIVVASQALSADMQAAVKSYVERGGLALLVPRDDEAASSLFAIFDDVQISSRGTAVSAVPNEPDPPRTADTAVARDARPEKYLLLGEIGFSHPLFAPFASPRYNDFTKIHFWKHRSVTLKEEGETRVVARFDNGEPAVLERGLNKGRIFALTSGWHPEDSQLALSSKFVPMIGALLELACGESEVMESATVHQQVFLPVNVNGDQTFVIPPNGPEVRIPNDLSSFSETNQPGIYRVKSGSTETRFAVNLSPSESNTAPLNLEQLEQRGVRFGADLTRTERIDRERQQRDTELENRQKVWRWLIVAALALLMLETWWAGRAERQIRSVT
jgi:hypothetical protein